MTATSKRAVHGVLVKLLHHKQTNRGMTLCEFATRCVLRHEIHELVTTDETGKTPGQRIDRVGFLGFAEIDVGGVVEIGDEVHCAGTVLGRVIGFDECHFPNHYNILIAVPSIVSAREQGLRVEDEIVFKPQTQH